MINNLIQSIYKNLTVKNESKDLNKNQKKINSNTINLKSTQEDKKLTLVEEIEEFGFIPSIDKKNNSNAA
jgi:DNA helicase TIP49 (TBP-interacting protein)